MDNALLHALAGGLCLAIIAGPLGCVLVWNRMAFFGEALAHGALLGVGISLFFHLHVFIGIIASSALLAILMLLMQKGKHLSNDSLLGVLSHSFLAIGLLVLSLSPPDHDATELTTSTDTHNHSTLEAYLFGDIMHISLADIGIIFVIGTLTMLGLAIIWQRLLLITFNEDLAIAEGIGVTKIQCIFMMLVACAIAIAMQYVGILLTMSLLIIPAATACRFANSPEKMAVLSSVSGMLAVSIGIIVATLWHTPIGPTIVVAATTILIISYLIPKRRLT